MSDEQRMILQMVAEGKITADEGARLLESLESKSGAPSDTNTIEDWGERISSFFSGDGAEWMQNLSAMFGSKTTYREERDRTLDAKGVSLIQTETTNGSILATGTDTPEIEVHARITVRAPREEEAREFCGEVEILIDRVDDRIQIGKAHRSPPPGISVSVDFTIQCPTALNLDLRSTNGRVTGSHIHGDVNVVTTNGKIALASLGGGITAQSANGAIQVSHHHLKKAIDISTKNGAIGTVIESGNSPVRLTTRNGSISLGLPGGFSGILDASTRNGAIHSELAIIVSHQDRRHLAGQIGIDGDTPVHLMTKNGAIRLK